MAGNIASASSFNCHHYNDVIMGAIASQITSRTIVFSTVYLDTDQRKRQSSAPLAFVRGIHRRPVNSPHKWPVTRKMFPLDDVIMIMLESSQLYTVSGFNSSPPGQNGRHFADDIFRWFFVNEKFCISIKISLKFVTKDSIEINPALV